MSPEGVDLDDINREALKLANEIQKLNVENWEYGALIYVFNGQVFSTVIFTQQNPNSVSPTVGDLNSIPDGANIVAFIHNHPSIGDSNTNGAIPSPGDFDIFSELRSYIQDNMAGRGLTVDRNSLLYIHGKDSTGGQPNKTRVYDRRDENRTDPECPLQ